MGATMGKPPAFMLPDGDDGEIELPTVWEICGTCRGHGAHSHAVDGHGITESEWNGPDWDDDQRAFYLSGGYDRECEDCQGSGKVAVVDYDRLTPELRARYDEWAEDERQYRAMCDAERWMGA